MVLGLQSLPVRLEAAAPDTRNTLFFSLVMVLTASATDEVGTSTTASTLSTSNHCRTMLEPTSGLFWWSANTTSILSWHWVALQKSSTAFFAAHTEPCPDRSESVPDWSFSTPSLMMPSLICA